MTVPHSKIANAAGRTNPFKPGLPPSFASAKFRIASPRVSQKDVILPSLKRRACQKAKGRSRSFSGALDATFSCKGQGCVLHA
jgi:hypothetical protein